MLHPRKIEVVNENKFDPMCEEAGLMLPPKLSSSVTQSVPVRSTIESERQKLLKVKQVATVAPQLSLANAVKMKPGQMAETDEENSVRNGRLASEQDTSGIKPTEDFLPHRIVMQDGNFCMPDMGVLKTPLQIRSGEEQSAGHELIKALSNFKQNVVLPLCPSFLQNNSSKKEAIVGSPEGNQCCIQKPKFKLKSQKPSKVVRNPDIKVVRDLLTKKWIFIRRDKKLGDLKLLSALKQLGDMKLSCILKQLGGSRSEAFKKLSEVVVFMEAMRKLTEATEQRKMRRVSDKHNTTNSKKNKKALEGGAD